MRMQTLCTEQAKSGSGLSICTTIDVLVTSKCIRTLKDRTPTCYFFQRRIWPCNQLRPDNFLFVTNCSLACREVISALLTSAESTSGIGGIPDVPDNWVGCF